MWIKIGLLIISQLNLLKLSNFTSNLIYQVWWLLARMERFLEFIFHLILKNSNQLVTCMFPVLNCNKKLSVSLCANYRKLVLWVLKTVQSHKYFWVIVYWIISKQQINKFEKFNPNGKLSLLIHLKIWSWSLMKLSLLSFCTWRILHLCLRRMGRYWMYCPRMLTHLSLIFMRILCFIIAIVPFINEQDREK